MILQGFEPWTHALEGRCSNPTELQNQPFDGCKSNHFLAYAKGLRRFFEYFGVWSRFGTENMQLFSQYWGRVAHSIG